MDNAIVLPVLIGAMGTVSHRFAGYIEMIVIVTSSGASFVFICSGPHKGCSDSAVFSTSYS